MGNGYHIAQHGYRACPPLQRILLNSTARRSIRGMKGFGAFCTLFLALLGWVSINVDRADLQARLLHRSPQRDAVVRGNFTAIYL